MVDVNEVAENIYMIDDELLSIPQLGSVYLLNEARKALVESGPPSSASVVLDGIRKVGVRPEDVAYVIVTHVHLDHAGGAGVLLRHMPEAKAVVHYKGAKHLIEPAKLVGSATEIQGAEVLAGYGEVIPIEPHRVQAVYDNDTIKLSEKQVLDFIDAPGHAPHELCIYERRNGGLFTGDAVGFYMAENEFLFPSHPPPSFDLELCISTIQRLMKLKATTIYFSHFGTSHKVQENLQLAIDKLRTYGDIVAKAVKEHSLDSVAEQVMAQAQADFGPVRRIPPRIEFAIKYIVPSCIDGYIAYYQERYKAELTE